MKKVVLAAGHGGKDPGAVGNNVKEKDLALIIALEVGSILKTYGVTVLQTRNDDTFVGLNEQANIANRFEADVFVSIHLNSAKNIEARGVETFSYRNSVSGKKLAQSIQTAITTQNIFTADRGCKPSEFTVLQATKMPAALVELGFISNKDDVVLVQRNIKNIASAVAKGILNYLGITHERSTDMDGEMIFKKLNEYLNSQPTTPAATKSSKKGVDSGLFSDGDGDGLVDNPRGILTREQFAVVLDRAGLLD